MAYRVIRFFQLMVRIGLPLGVVVLLGFGTYDRFHPWALADELLPNRPSQTRILIGGDYSSRSTYAASGNITERRAEYVFYPEVLKTRESYFVSRRSDRAPSVTIKPFSPTLYILGIVAAVVLSVAAWSIPLTRKKTGAHVA